VHRFINLDNRRRADRGFTLVELLIVIVILGVLATVTVFAVRGITDQGESSAAASDVKTLESAEESHMAKFGTYASESDLVAAGLLREQSTLHDITLAAGSYSVVAQAVAGPTTTGAGAPSGGATQGVASTIAGVPAMRLGTGAAFIFVGGADAAAEWDRVIAAGWTAWSGDAFYFVDVADITSTAVADSLAIAAPGRFAVEDDVSAFAGAQSMGAYFDSHGPISLGSLAEYQSYLIAP
jgi:prepilin-type N-terminal cleavage/methylation domain-containing protein